MILVSVDNVPAFLEIVFRPKPREKRKKITFGREFSALPA
jgi:hypothetical protein